MYRIGKKQKRAILTANGNEVVVFPKGKEALAEKVCNLLNTELEVNKISSSAVLSVTSDSKNKNKKKSVVAVCDWHKEPIVGHYYVECKICGYLRIEVKQTD